MKNILKYILTAIPLLVISISLSSCYKKFADAPYPAQTVYMPAAANGFYVVNSVAVPGQTYRYTVDPTAGKLYIPLAAYRSGLTNDGDLSINISAKTDTANTLISSGAITNTLPLPVTTYTIPSSVSIPGGAYLGQFALSIDLSFLLANPAKSYVVAVGISTSQVKSTTRNTTVIIISPAFLVPAANFTYALDANTARKYNFTNTTVNGVSYSWDFGDGTPAVTDVAPSHIYAASGSYTVTLTTVGAAGAVNQSVKTTTLVIP